jgi:carboxymethylenebutenolidase
MTTFESDGNTRDGYLALPESRQGRGILVLHAWWGLNEFFKQLCDRLAAEGFVAFAPDLHLGRIATTPDEAERILQERDYPATEATAVAALDFLRRHPATVNPKVGALGFSMGAAFALELSARQPDAFAAAVLFYGGTGADLAGIPTRFLAHFGETDTWEPLEEVKKMQAPNLTMHLYPGAGHWFFEDDRPDAYDAEAAALAWERSIAFFKAELPG